MSIKKDAQDYIMHWVITALSMLHMATTAIHVARTESIALVFQKRLTTRDPCYFKGMFQQLNV